MKITFNLSILESLDDGDSKFLKDMINLFIESTGKGIIEIKEELKKKDYLAIADKAHKLVGPCKQMELMPLSSTLKSIEMDIFEENKFDRLPELIAQAESEFEESVIALKKHL